MNYFNFRINCVQNASCCAATGQRLVTSPCVADTDIFFMNTFNTLLESYQQRVYKNTLATNKCQIQPVENPTPAVVITVEAACVDNAILLNYFTFEVAFDEPEIGSNDENIPTDHNWMENKLHFGIAGGIGDYDDEAEESQERDRIPSPGRRQQAGTELERFDLGTDYVDTYECEDRNNANADLDEKKDALPGYDGTTQNVDNLEHGRFHM
jgi:hypothetical protein